MTSVASSSSSAASTPSSPSSSRSPLSPLSRRRKAAASASKASNGSSDSSAVMRGQQAKQATVANRMYRALPSALRRDDRNKGRSQAEAKSEAHPPPTFGGLNLNNLSNLISGGIHFFGHALGKNRKAASTASTPSGAPSSPDSSASSGPPKSSSAVFFSDIYESIELASFPCIPEAGEGQTGEGHLFHIMGTFNPTWCDLCGDLIWGLYDTGASKCQHCNYTCHVKCQKRVRLNCSNIIGSGGKERSNVELEPIALLSPTESEYKTALVEIINTEDEFQIEEDERTIEDDSTLANISTLKSEVNNSRAGATTLITESDVKSSVVAEVSDSDDEDDYKTLKDVDHLELEHDDSGEGTMDEARLTLLETLQLPLRSPDLFGDDLEKIVAEYNSAGHTGQETVLEGPDSCRGFIRVQMNLRRPINVISGTRPPSIYNITKEDTLAGRKTLTSFYLPPDTVKALHVMTATTTIDVIRSLLCKFRVADNPHKYALYEKTEGGARPSSPENKGTLSRVRMRRMKDAERPLVLALKWCRDGILSDKLFVLQENDPGEISWESFSVPELKNFLLILDREEAWYKKKIHEKYEAVEAMMKQLAEERLKEEKEEEKQDDSTKI